jgi:hypothetical protein
MSDAEAINTHNNTPCASGLKPTERIVLMDKLAPMKNSVNTRPDLAIATR